MKSIDWLKVSLSVLLGLLTTAATHFNSHAVAGMTDVFESGWPLPYSFVGWLSGRSWDWRAAGVDVVFWAGVWFVVLWTIAWMRRWQALTWVLLLLLTACQAAPQTRAQPTATAEPLLSEAEAGARMIDHLRQLGLEGEFKISAARQLSLRDAVREVAGQSRLDRALVEAGVGQPGREADKPVWFFDVQTTNRRFPYLLYFMDARTGEVMDWPTPPEALTPPPPNAPIPPRPTDPPRPTRTAEEEQAEIRKLHATGEAIRTSMPPLVVTIVGKPVVLPYDVMVGKLMGGGSDRDKELTLSRSKSLINIDRDTGVVLLERIAPGEEGAFDFLKPYVVTPTPPRPN